MRALLDVNMLIALLDGGHIHHRLATEWIEKNIGAGWASCPITQNGCIRIMSHSSYPNALPAAQVAARLAEATQHSSHQFWPDTISLLQPGGLKWDQVLSSRHVTDVYLLALSVEHGGRLVTLDRGVPIEAISGALASHLVVLT
jgi:hypothetical protein